MALNEAAGNDSTPDPIQDALKIIRDYHSQFIAFKEEQVIINATVEDSLSSIKGDVESVKTAVSESIEGTTKVLGEINTSLTVLKEDKMVREAVASAVEKTPWGMFKAAFVRAGVVFFVGGIWVLIGWSALSLYNSFKGGDSDISKQSASSIVD